MNSSNNSFIKNLNYKPEYSAEFFIRVYKDPQIPDFGKSGEKYFPGKMILFQENT